MGDVADILGFGGSANAGTPPPLKPKREEKIKTKSKLHREVLLLQENQHSPGLALGLGGRSHVSIMPSNNLPMKKSLLKQRPALRNKWVRRDFLNAARSDGLVLTHWVKSSLPEGLEYPFARFNVTCEASPCCTKEEYEKDLSGLHDPLIPTPWSFEDTIYLWEVCKRYELRWIVIADRFNCNVPSKQNRSVEDIKYWYYEVTRILADRRHVKADIESTATKVEPIATTDVPPIPSAPALTDEVKLEPTDDTLKITAPVDVTPVAPPPPPPSVFRFNIVHEKQRKTQLELQFNRSNAEESAMKKLQEDLRNVELQLKKAVLRVDQKKKKELAEARQQIVREIPSGVYFRSSTQVLPTQKMSLSAKLTKKLNLMLDEFGIPARPMPTKQICEKYDKVRQDILSLIALRKTLTSRVTEVHSLAEKLSTATGVPYIPQSNHRPADLDKGGFGGDSMGLVQNGLVATGGAGQTKLSQKGGATSMKRKTANNSHVAAKRPKKIS